MEIFAGDSIVYSMLLTRIRFILIASSKSDFDSSTTAYTAYISNFSLLNRRFQKYTTVSSSFISTNFGDNPVPEGSYHYFAGFETFVTNVEWKIVTIGEIMIRPSGTGLSPKIRLI